MCAARQLGLWCQPSMLDANKAPVETICDAEETPAQNSSLLLTVWRVRVWSSSDDRTQGSGVHFIFQVPRANVNAYISLSEEGPCKVVLGLTSFGWKMECYETYRFNLNQMSRIKLIRGKPNNHHEKLECAVFNIRLDYLRENDMTVSQDESLHQQMVPWRWATSLFLFNKWTLYGWWSNSFKFDIRENSSDVLFSPNVSEIESQWINMEQKLNKIWCKILSETLCPSGG